MAANKKQFIWKRRPSEIRGYERAMYTTLENGDYIRVDYNTGEKIVRLYAEVLDDKGASYYAVINKGKITVEKNSSGRSARVADTLKERAQEFSTLPNTEVLKLINNNYGISIYSTSKDSERNERLQKERDVIKKKYFKPEDNPYVPHEIQPRGRMLKFSIVDLFDILGGLAVSGIFFFITQYDLNAAGAAAVIWGMLLGVFDILIRNREPFFLKIIFFLLAGGGIYIYSYIYL
jgi:hypothetical protein